MTDEQGRVHRALRTLSAGNRTLLRARDEGTLLQDMCRVIVDHGYLIAWVGYAQHDEQRSIRPMSCVGLDSKVLEATPLTWGDTGLGLGPTGTALRTGRPVIGRNILNDPALGQWRDEAIVHGHAAISAFPLRIDGELLGNLSITAADADAFDEAEVRLLAELADDLAYGIANLRIRERHREAEKTIERMAYEDALTGLPNRLALCERLRAALDIARQAQRSLALLIVKVGGFGEINDTLGYRQGDRLLQEISARLAAQLADGVILARVGDDDFAVLLPGGGADDASRTAAELMNALRRPVDLGELTVDARGSVGVALFPGHGDDPEVLLRRASIAAYHAKRTAAGHALYAGSLDQDCTRRLALMGDLHRAIANDELRLYCQPKVAFGSGRICGAEALLRWQHPRAGLIAPDEFIKLAERAGLIRSLTRWVLEAAFRQAYAWQAAGQHRPLSINLSAQDLHDPALADRVRGLFATWGNRPELIQFELTESALMDDPEGARETLAQLKRMDVQLFIDDYGTGYSSLRYLQTLPVDAIKIDQSFVADMVANEDSATIVRSTIELGHNLDLSVVAEGVENQAIWDRLSALGCDTAQGFFVGMPVRIESLAEWEMQSRWHA
ncbi:EAL domain-containing protein [Aromatoleum toluolicum]|uniref:putative bifunctional diguanylate cyclase/phosphodiesterase n=1 Tax=Aromatoleum toluolicum TaxID=90060 RepID=UPI0021093696|nr:GGDEF domain-containing protein [Aromatoleum toluolicum]NMG00112.2 EAL domain-containing protein [Aromatoleum toluolicum]